MKKSLKPQTKAQVTEKYSDLRQRDRYQESRPIQQVFTFQQCGGGRRIIRKKLGGV